MIPTSDPDTNNVDLPRTIGRTRGEEMAKLNARLTASHVANPSIYESDGNTRIIDSPVEILWVERASAALGL